MLVVFIAGYALALSRKVKIAYASLGASALFLILESAPGGGNTR